MKTTKPKTKAPKMKAVKEPSIDERILELEARLNRAFNHIAIQNERIAILENKGSWRSLINKIKGNG